MRAYGLLWSAVLVGFLTNAIALAALVDFATMCGFTTNEANLVGFTFDDGTTTLADGNIVTGTLTLREDLYENPPSVLEISAPGVVFGRKRFRFDRNDPSTYRQNVSCRTDGGSAGGITDIAMIFNYTVDDPNLDASKLAAGLCKKLRLKRQTRPCGRGGGVGDPHLTTLDGVNYNFQVPGVFRLFESRNFLVQVFQEKCTPVAAAGDAAPSCYQGVAFGFGGSVVRMLIKNRKIALAKGTASVDWFSVEKIKGNTEGFRVFLTVDQATYVDVTMSTWINNYPYLNIALQVSPYFKDPNVNGLLGNWNGRSGDDLRDNAQLAQLHGFGLGDNLFTCVNDGCVKFLKPTSVKDDIARSLPNDMPLLHQSYSRYDPAKILLEAFAPVLIPYVRPRALRHIDDGSQSAAASVQAHVPGGEYAAENETISFPPEKQDEQFDRVHDLCYRALTRIPGCDKYVPNRAFYIETVCVGDAMALGDLTIIDSTKLIFLRECRRVLDSRIETNATAVEETQTMLHDRAALSFGDISTCANNCGGRGSCLAAGCKCDNGYTGFACEIEI